LLKWGDQKRDHDPILAVWPSYRPLWGRYLMTELVATEEGGVRWRDRRIPHESGGVRMDHHPDRDTAFAASESLNPTFAAALAGRDMPEPDKSSLTLKVRKALQSRQRLDAEEALMLAEAVRRHHDTPRQMPNELHLHPEAEPFRDALARELQTYPYLRMALISTDGRTVVVYRDANDLWSKPYYAGEKAAVSAMRARIANGFKHHQDQHWGQVKARIRAELLPRANQLLQLASVQRMLAEALARGERVLVSNGIVFWYEPDGQLGWTVKSTTSDKGEDGATRWQEGTIISTNHGRLVVLPYIKENGEFVRGHTKNGPGDGRAKPRHPEHYVEIPFREFKGDLMIGLFGELPYE
jgi:hypothetical protein